MKPSDKAICDQAVAILRDWAERDKILIEEDRAIAAKRRARKKKQRQLGAHASPRPQVNAADLAKDRTLH